MPEPLDILRELLDDLEEVIEMPAWHERSHPLVEMVATIVESARSELNRWEIAQIGARR